MESFRDTAINEWYDNLNTNAHFILVSHVFLLLGPSKFGKFGTLP